MNWKDIQDDREKYAAYLCSREWSVLKKAVHKRANGLCERCLFLPIDSVHHKTYERKYNESLEDLEGNCKHCHSYTHGKIDVDPAAIPHQIRFYLHICAGFCDWVGKLIPYPIEFVSGREPDIYHKVLICAIEHLRSFEKLVDYPLTLSYASDSINKDLPYDYKYWHIHCDNHLFNVNDYETALRFFYNFSLPSLDEKFMLPEDEEVC